MMRDGKKSVAQRMVYDAMDEIEKRTKGNPPAIEVFEKAVEQVRPAVEVRSKRVGGTNYQVPMQVNHRRQQSLAFRWIIQSVRSESGRPTYQRLARELMDASKGDGKAMNTREQVHRMANANKAFAHFAW
jgi:small subunit ribosomal protein S7